MIIGYFVHTLLFNSYHLIPQIDKQLHNITNIF